MTLAKSVALAACALLLIAGPALAQDKIAPSRSYRNDNYSGYSDVPRQRPDRNFGLPAFGMPGSEVPQQKTLATHNSTAPGAPANANPGAPQPDADALLPAPHGSSAPPAPGVTTDAYSAPDLDFFQKQGGKSFLQKHSSRRLPKPGSTAADNDGMDTPMFTTPDGASSSGTED